MPTIEEKIDNLSYILVTLANKAIKDGVYTDLEDFNKKNNFTIDKVLLLPYLIITANGLENRKLLLKHVGDVFKVMDGTGYIEHAIEQSIKSPTFQNNYFKFVNEKLYIIGNKTPSIDNNAKNGIDHSLAVYSKTKKDLIKLSFEELLSGMSKSRTLDKIYNLKLFNKIIPNYIIEQEKTIFTEAPILLKN